MFIGEILANMTQVSDVAPWPLVTVTSHIYYKSYNTALVTVISLIYCTSYNTALIKYLLYIPHKLQYSACHSYLSYIHVLYKLHCTLVIVTSFSVENRHTKTYIDMWIFFSLYHDMYRYISPF
jgi:hypothetical protein